MPTLVKRRSMSDLRSWPLLACFSCIMLLALCHCRLTSLATPGPPPSVACLAQTMISIPVMSQGRNASLPLKRTPGIDHVL